MKALYFEQHGDLDVVKYGDVPDPQPGPGEVLIRVRACALNFLDIWVRVAVIATTAWMDCLYNVANRTTTIVDSDASIKPETAIPSFDVISFAAKWVTTVSKRSSMPEIAKADIQNNIFRAALKLSLRQPAPFTHVSMLFPKSKF